MPFFDFVCEVCKEEFEVLVMGSKPRLRCPKCKSKNLHKKVSSFAVGGRAAKSSSSEAASKCAGCSSCH